MTEEMKMMFVFVVLCGLSLGVESILDTGSNSCNALTSYQAIQNHFDKLELQKALG